MAADTPSVFTSGQVTIPAASAVQLGPLVQANVDKNAPLSSYYFSITSDGVLFMGMDLTVSAVKWGATLAANGSKVYTGTIANPIPWGRFFVFSTAGTTAHIEIIA